MQSNTFIHGIRRGFTLIEIIVGAALFTIVATAVYGTYAGIFKLANLNQVSILAVNLADEQFEIIRNMPYSSIGIVSGIPSGILPASTTVTRGGIAFTVSYIVRDIDLPFDGVFASSTNNDTAPADNKFVQISVSCPTCQNFSPVIVSGHVAPKNLENSTNNGALFVQVIDANGNPVQGASVHVSYLATSSPIVIDDTTNNLGMLQLVDIPPAVQAYSISTNKFGYSSDQTYAASSTNPSPYKPPATVVAQQLTQLSLSIDKASSFSISSMGPTCASVPNFHFDLSGNKTVGPGVLKYKKSLVTDSSGSLSLGSMEWDTYTIAPTDSSSDLIGLDPLNPISLSPGNSQSIRLIAVPKNGTSLLVTVKDSSTGLPLSGATVEVAGPGYDQTLVTGQGFFNQTDWSHGPTQSGLFSDPIAYASGSGVDASTSTGNVILQNDGMHPYSTIATGTLDSSVFDTGSTSIFSTLSWTPTSQSPLTGSNSVLFQIATNSSSTPAVWDFFGPDGTASSYYSAQNSTISAANDSNRYARYRLFMTTQTATATPVLSSVSLTYTSGCIPPGQVIFSGLQQGSQYTVSVSAPGYAPSSMSVSPSSSWQETQASLIKL